MKLNPSKFGPRLATILRTLDMTQSELAERSGLTQAAISQILSCERDPSLESVCKLLMVVPVKFEKLVIE